MKNKMLPFLIACTLLWNSSVLAGDTVAKYTLQLVEDGDTVVIDVDGQPLRIQLVGIDAPERIENPKFNLDLEKTGLDKAVLLSLGEAATQHLQTLLPTGEEVTLQGDLSKKDKYGRIPAQVFNAAGKSVSEAMVQDGFAIPLTKSSLPEKPGFMRRLDRLERFSSKSQNGLWGGNSRETMHNWYDRTR